MVFEIHVFISHLTLIACLMFSLNNSAKDVSFDCDFTACLFQHNVVYAICLVPRSAFLAAENVTEGKINATAYNPKDEYTGQSLTSPF